MCWLRIAAIVAGLLLARPLARAEETRTDAFGDPLPPHVVSRLGTVRFRHTDCARTIAFSPDGKLLASVGRGDTMRLWEVPSGKEVLRTHDEDGDSEALAWSNDGKWIAVEKFRLGIQIRDAMTAQPVRNLEGGHASCAVAFSANGQVCAATTFRQRVLAWDTSTGRRLLDADACRSGERPGLAISPDGTRLWTFLAGTKPRLWDLVKGQEIALPHAEMGHAALVAFSEDGDALALADPDGLVRVFAGDGPPQRLGVVEGGLAALRFLGDGATLAAVARSGAQARWITADGASVPAPSLQEYTRFARVIGLPPSVAISRDGQYVASSGVAISLWKAATGELLSPTDGPPDVPISVEFSPDGRYLASSNEGGTVELWDLVTGARAGVYRFEGEDPYPLPLGFTASGEALVVSDFDETIAVLRVPDMAPLRIIPEVSGYAIALVDGGRTAVLGAWDESLSLLDLRDGSRSRRGIGQDRFCSEFGCAAVSPDGTLIAWTDVPITNKGRGGLTLSSVESGRIVREFPKSITWGARFWFTPDGTHIVITGGEARRWTLWNASTGDSVNIEESDCRTSGGRVSYSFDRDEALVVRRASDLSIVWKLDPDCGECCASAVSEDGRHLVSAMQDSTILVWEVPPEAVMPPTTIDAPLEELWEMLGSRSSWDVRRTSATLVAKGDDAVAFLRGRLTPSQPPADTLEALVARFEGEDPLDRQQAQDELERLAPDAEAFLRQALVDAKSAESRARLDRVVEGAFSPLACAPDRLRRLRGIWALGRMATPAARDALRATASALGDTREVRAARSALERIR